MVNVRHYRPAGTTPDQPALALFQKQWQLYRKVVDYNYLGVIPAMTSADNGYSSQEGREEVLGLGVKVVSISGAKGKRLLEAQQWKSRPYRQARAERSAIESLVFSLKEDFEFGEMARRTHENVLAEMLEKVLAYNISQMIRVRKKLSEAEQMERAAA
jgi:hypothetical protein